jgi:hypothetical protein
LPVDLDSYAAGAERFLSELDREYHLHFSGQKDDYEVEAVYERHASLFERSAVEGLREAVATAEGDQQRRASYLLEFAVDGHMGRACAAEEAAIAAREAELELEVDGERIPYRGAPIALANEADPERRRRIEAARLATLEEHLNPLHLRSLERSHELIGELGWPSYADAYAELRGIDLEELRRQTQAFLVATADAYPTVIGPQLEDVLGFGLEEAGRADLSRFFRAPTLDSAFDGERLIPSFTEAMSGIGLDLERQSNIIFDTEQRPTKTSRAYCAPVLVPQEVYLVVPRVGGREDFAALFHEGGHAEHYANMAADLPVEYRYLGDNSVTESFAFLVEHMTENGDWLREVLGAEPEPILAHVEAVRLYFLRRYAAKLAYELELHGPGADLSAMPARYAELISAAIGIEWTSESWLDDVDGGFYVAAYLRAWALEAGWRRALAERFGERWFSEPAAGHWLRELWQQGQRLRAHELVAEATGDELRFDALAAEFAV